MKISALYVDSVRTAQGTYFTACSPDTTPAEPYPNSNTQQIKNVTANVVVQQHSQKLLKMGILTPETYWVSKE